MERPRGCWIGAVLREDADCKGGQAEPATVAGSGTSPLPRVPSGARAVDRPERRAIPRESVGSGGSMGVQMTSA